MNNYFIFNQQHSLNEYGLLFETMPVLPLASFSEVENPQITCQLGYKTNSDTLLRLRAWLAQNQGELRFSFDPRLFKVNNIISQEVRKNKTFTVIQIIFEVEKYCMIESNLVTIKENFNDISIINIGTFSSFPKLTIKGHGDITVSLNNVIICRIERVDGQVVLDSDIQECFIEVGDSISLKNRDFYGEFLVIPTGENILSFTSSGIIETVQIMPRWVI